MSDRELMAQALALAALGEGSTHPNPLVGCVIAREGRVIGHGYHQAAGLPHAEILALDRAGASASGSTLYVNLEPCVHQGRTGPCTEAIVRAGVKRVVAATGDPNPLVDGRGFAALQAAGIELTRGVLEAEARALNAAFLSIHERGRPWVTVKSALSIDGRISHPGVRFRWISGEASRRFAHRLRFAHDAILVGAGTIRKDDPLLTTRLQGVEAHRLRAVLAPKLAISPRARVFSSGSGDSPRTRIYAAEDVPDADRRRFERVADVVPVPCDDGGLDLPAVLADLASVGVHALLIEGGGRTAGAFLAADLVDELMLFIAGSLLGSVETRPLADVAGTLLGTPWRLDRTSVIPLGDDVVLTGTPRRG